MPMSLGSYSSRVVATLVVATDGTGDYTTIQSAVDNLPSGGGVIYVKEGSYNEKITISINNVSLIGSGRGTSIWYAGNNNTMLTISANNCFVDKILIYNSSPTIGSTIISVSGSDNIITNIWCGRADTTVNITGSRNVISYVHSDTDSGFGSVPVITISTGTQNLLSNCIFKGGNPFNISSDKNVISSCSFSGCNRAPSLSGSNCVVSSCNFYGLRNGSDLGDTTDGFTISGNSNQITANLFGGITGALNADTNYDVVISGNSNNFSSNIIDTCNGDGASVYNCLKITGDYNIIGSNNIRNTDGTGILIDTTSDRTLVHGNIVYDTVTTTITNNGTNTTLADNITA